MITLYGVGFGLVVPSIPAGQIVEESNTLVASLQVKFGTTVATTTYDGLSPSAIGLYQFNVVVPTIASSDTVPLTFTLGGVPGTQTLYLAVQNANTTPQVQSLTLSPSSVAGGGTVQGTVTLSAAAPAGGAVVTLSSNSSAATLPATVAVPAGATSASFTITTGIVSPNQTVTIIASYGGGSAQATLTVSGGGTLPQYTLITVSPTFSADGQTSSSASTLEIQEMASGSGYVIIITPVAYFGSFNFAVSFTTVSVSGQTLILSGLQPGNLNYVTTYSPLVQSPISAGSMAITLGAPSGSGVGNVTGSITGTFTLTTPLETLTGTISGTYIADGGTN